ncbi:type II restriction endonuclease, PabI family [Campylobacter iguaniorum]|uniref:R.Pab1 family restriction endonuclease n=1 Tax=Campylobacter iguaniorum TaxID=1244531 RepID=UPI0007C9CC80|nr:R.Pab1 family restriction endonuclease [Campylobacter iguaniorum]ANE36003.1 type II restriction endonuclease, PabI family [Campylobacter iguaniorum]
MLRYKIPLTQTSGKIRIKERLAFSDYGLPIPPTKTTILPKHYIEWQIGYDNVVDSNEHFIGANGKKKQIYELSEILLFGLQNNYISKNAILDLKNFIGMNSIFIESTQEILRSSFKLENIAGIDFLKSKVSYPLLVHEFKNKDIICEIIVREKQRAIGIMPMLYFCVPMSSIYDESRKQSFIGRCVQSKEFGYLHIENSNIAIFIQMFKIFGILSQNHKHDCLAILEYILNMQIK